MAKLTDEQLAQFETEGYVMVPDVFEPHHLQPIRDELTQLIHDSAVELA